ncbi:MAG: HAMP domain-containing protein [Halanaeroarchaeum sp.]
MKSIVDRSIRRKVTAHVLVVVGLFSAGTVGSVVFLLGETRPPGPLLWLVLALTILAVVGAVGLLYLIDRHLLRPLERLSRDASTVAQGDLDHEIRTHWADDEMGRSRGRSVPCTSN